MDSKTDNSPPPSPLKMGTVIKLDTHPAEAVRAVNEALKDAYAGFDAASAAVRHQQGCLWKTIRAAVPELNEWELVYDVENSSVRLTYPKTQTV